MDSMTKLWITLLSIIISLLLLVIFVDEYQINKGYPSIIKKRLDEEYIPLKDYQTAAIPSRLDDPSTSIVPELEHKDSTEQISEAKKLKGAVIIDDMGMDYTVANELLSFGIPLTFSILPNMPYTEKVARLAHESGMVVLAHIPMESIDETKMVASLPWLLIGMSEQKINEILESIFDQVKYAQGANNHTGSRFTTDRRGMTTVLSFIKNRGLFFIDSRTTTATIAFEIAQSLGIPSAERKVFFDDADDEDSIIHEFERFIQVIENEGHAIGIGHPKPNTIKVLRRYVHIFEKRGIELVPVTTLLKPPLTPDQLAFHRTEHHRGE